MGFNRSPHIFSHLALGHGFVAATVFGLGATEEGRDGRLAARRGRGFGGHCANESAVKKKKRGPAGEGAGTRSEWRVKGTPLAVPKGVWCGVARRRARFFEKRRV